MSHFYITLPSNASMDIYPQNTVAQYVTKLADTVELDGSWEVGLVEIIYPHIWKNVRDNEAFLILNLLPTSEVINSEVTIAGGHYEDGYELMRAINSSLRNIDIPTPIFSFDSSRKRAVVSMYDVPYSLTMSEHMKQVLGFTKVLKPGIEHTSDNEVNLDGGFSALYVYCNLLEQIHVGDTKAPLLRSIGVQGRYGDVIHQMFDNPTYVPVQKKVFDTIEIDIMDDSGHTIPFEGGKSLVTLHFRRANDPYFLRR